jgi:hypothetical protein
MRGDGETPSELQVQLIKGYPKLLGGHFPEVCLN